MFIPTAYKCPIAKATKGLIEIDPVIIGKLAGAVHEPDEWLIILLGEKSEGGLHVIVDGIYVPSNQERTGHTCEVRSLPNEISPFIVGALHSHHRMGAKFSGSYGGKSGDRGEDGLNMTFQMSIVISNSYKPDNVEANLLGFDYEADLTADAPGSCTGLIKCSAKIIPRGIEDWPFKHQIVRPPTNLTHKSLGDCMEYSESEDSTTYKYKRDADCGLREGEFNTKERVFGFDYDSIVSRLPKVTPPPQVQYHNGKELVTYRDSKYYDKDDKDMDRWMDHSEYVDAYYGR